MQKKSILRSVSTIGSLSFALLVCSALAPVQAGFQWVPPESSVLVPAIAPAPVASPEYPIVPQIIEAPEPKAPVSAPKNMEPPLPLDAMMDVPVAPRKAELPKAQMEPSTLSPAPEPSHYLRAPEGMVDAPAPRPVAPALENAPLPLPVKEPASTANVRGFAKNVPLAVALRQVLPADYGFSIDQNVSFGTQVSWQGGAPWREVLRDMLAPAGLMMKEKDQLVEITQQSSLVGEAVMKTAPEPMGKSAGIENLSPSFDAASLSAPQGKTSYLLPLEQESPAKTVLAPVPLSPVPQDVMPAPGQKTMGYLTAPADALPASASQSPAPVSLLGGDMVVDSWVANKGETLHEVLKGWAKRANIELSWQAEYDFPLQASIAFGGTFEEAVRGLLVGFENATPQPIGMLHKNQVAGQTVLIVQTRGNKYTD